MVVTAATVAEETPVDDDDDGYNYSDDEDMDGRRGERDPITGVFAPFAPGQDPGPGWQYPGSRLSGMTHLSLAQRRTARASDESANPGDSADEDPSPTTPTAPQKPRPACLDAAVAPPAAAVPVAGPPAMPPPSGLRPPAHAVTEEFHTEQLEEHQDVPGRWNRNAAHPFLRGDSSPAATDDAVVQMHMHDGCITSGSTIMKVPMSVEKAKRKCAAACTESEGLKGRLKGLKGFMHEGGPTDGQVTVMCYFKTFKASEGPKISRGLNDRGLYCKQWTSYTWTEPERMDALAAWNAQVHLLNSRRVPSPAADGAQTCGLAAGPPVVIVEDDAEVQSEAKKKSDTATDRSSVHGPDDTGVHAIGWYRGKGRGRGTTMATTPP
jgi:hypothetical protein